MKHRDIYWHDIRAMLMQIKTVTGERMSVAVPIDGMLAPQLLNLTTGEIKAIKASHDIDDRPQQ